MPAENIGDIQLIRSSEPFDAARLPISAEVDDQWRGRAITGAMLLQLINADMVRTGTAEPSDSLLTSGRRALYFRVDTDGDVIELHVSFDGLSWKEVTIGSGDGGGDTIAEGAGITITEATDGTKTIAVSRPFTSQDESKLDGITAQATRNAAGDGIDESGGTFSINDAYVENLIGAADVYVEHFRLAYVSSFFSTQEARWGADADTIYMQPTVSNRPVVAALVDGEKIQVRNVDGSTRNTFTLDADVTGPDSSGVFTLNGDWEDSPIFVNGTNYGMYFSLNRPHGIPDDVTLELTDDNEIRIKAGGVRDDHIADDLSGDEQSEAQDRLGVERQSQAWGGQISVDHVAIDDIDTGSQARWTLEQSGNHPHLRFEDLSRRDRDYVASVDIGGQVGFYEGEHRRELATIVGAWNSVNNHFRIAFDTLGALSSSVDYDLRFTQFRPEPGIPPSGDDGQVLAKSSDDDYATEWVDPTSGLPTGGVDGQVLAKSSDVDFETEWVNQSTGGGTAITGDRSERITLQASTGGNIADEGRVISPVAGATAITVTLPKTGGGAAEMIGQGDNADGFEVLQAGIYDIRFGAVVDPTYDRATPVLRIYEYDADIATTQPIGETGSIYIRYDNDVNHTMVVFGKLELDTDNTMVKAVVANALYDATQPGADQADFVLAANSTIRLSRSGVKGDPGESEDGSTDLSIGTRSDEALVLVSSSGDNATLPAASPTQAGLMSGTNQTKLNALNTSRQLPSGGTANQILEKINSTDYNARWADPADDVDTFHLTVERIYVTGVITASNQITIVLHSGDVFNLGINRHMGVNVLPENYIDALPVGTEIRVATPDGSTEWNGELRSIHSETDTGAELRINFGDRTGTFTNNETVEVSFGYSPARIPRAQEIDVEGELDGTLENSDPDLESIIQAIDNFDLSGEVVSAGDYIEITGAGTTADPKVINNEAPFTDDDSDVLGELASSARHTLDDDLVLRLQYGAEHFFDGRSPVITGLAIIDGHIYVGSDDGFVNDQRGVNEEGIYDLTTNNNDPATAGNWYFADGSHIRIRERSASGLWTNASPSQDSTGIPVTAGIGISVDPENLTVMFFLHMRSDGIRIEGLTVSTFPSSGAITYESEHDITRASINTVLTANDLGTLSEIRNTIGNVGVTAMGALNNVVYFVVSGVINNDNGIPVSAILRITTGGSGASRTFALDTEYCKIVGIRNGVQGIVPTEAGFWLSTEHIVYEYHHSVGVGGGGFSSVALGDADLEPATENEWIATGIQIPEADDTDYLLINFGKDIVAGNPAQRRGGEKLVSVSKLRGLMAGTVGGTPTFTGSLNFEDDLSNNVLKLGRLASYELLYASLGPEPAVDFEVRRVLKAESAGLSTVAVNEDFFRGDGSEAEPIDLKASIGLTDRTRFRTRIDAQQNIPMAVYYLAGQTVRNPTTLRNFPRGSGARSRNICLSFTDVQQTEYGGDTAIVPHILWANIDVVADADWNGDGESRSSFTMSAGTYSFVMHVEGAPIGDLNTTLQLLEATPSVDDIIVSARPGWSGPVLSGGSQAPFGSEYYLSEEILPVANTQDFYFVIKDSGSSDQEYNGFRGYLIIKRHS